MPGRTYAPAGGWIHHLKRLLELLYLAEVLVLCFSGILESFLPADELSGSIDVEGQKMHKKLACIGRESSMPRHRYFVAQYASFQGPGIRLWLRKCT